MDGTLFRIGVFTDINRKRTRLSGDSLVLFLQKKAELQKKPVFRIIQINLCELLDALQTVGQELLCIKSSRAV